MRLNTWTGREVDPLRPDPSVVVIADIAHSLANQARYLGHTREPYSVAQHAVAVSRLCEREHALAGLLHDAAETYLGDLPSPVKRLPGLAAYRALEAAWLAVIFQAFGVPVEIPRSVQAIDERLRINEARDLFAIVPAWAQAGTPLPLQGRAIVAASPATAEQLFLRRFALLRPDHGPRATG